MQRDADALNEEVTTDSFFNFVVTGYSMIDWVKNDHSLPESTKDKAVIKSLYADKWLTICGDIATASKHFVLDIRKPITSSAISSQGFGNGRFGKVDFGEGEESIQIQLNDGTTFHCLDLVQGVLTSWDKFFLAHNIMS
ncbi:MAG: hypothetical protein HOL93_10860 [Candidatus Marinimicrobia bacterium]|nr:hypothetical protein [Candidatus Neomarinimicrobiota bacterium]